MSSSFKYSGGARQHGGSFYNERQAAKRGKRTKGHKRGLIDLDDSGLLTDLPA